MAQSENPNPKMQLPEAWAAKMACPVCSSQPLGVFHPTGHADRFACSTCETSFELEDAGKRVRFVTLPPGVTPWMRGEWVVLEEALAAFEIFKTGQSQPKAEGADKVAPVATAAPPSQPAIEAEPSVAKTAEPEPENSPVRNESVSPPEEKTSKETPGQLLFPTDKPVNPVNGASPFFEEDFTDGDGFPVEPPAGTPLFERDVWKDQELERVREALLHPPSGDFAGQLSTKDAEDPSGAVKESLKEPEKPETEPPVTASKPVFTVPASWTMPTTQAASQPVDYSSLDNPPPIRPLEDTPPSIIQPAPARPKTIYTTPEEDLGDLRDHIAGASPNVSSLNEKMEAAAERAVELHKLGNTPQEVRSILERSSGLTPEQVAEVLNNLEKPEEKRKSSRLILIFLIITVVIFTMLAWWFFNSQAYNELQGTLQETTPNEFSLAGKLVDPTFLPAQLQTLMPGGIQIFNEPPSTEKATESQIPAASCPTTPGQAASLFGGQMADWSKDNQSNGWTMITKTQGLEIRVPANMSAGYMVFERGPEMRGVSGPIFVRNIYMISVSCP